ncbi:MAG: glycosyltransferase [Lachnospiraceae bacterium]|nr:glycosyltransferase [Lachnospiraceae bacterium]
MGIVSNVLKTISYTKRNGVKSAYYAAKERLEDAAKEPYDFVPASEEELQKQRETYAAWRELSDNNVFDYLTKEHYLPRISIIVPCYKTPKRFLQAMIESVTAQTYENWELILVDASPEEMKANETDDEEAGVHIASVIYSLEDARIHYMRLKENLGISDNTNRALEYATGDYVGLLDHDDLLTPDALFSIVHEIKEHLLPLPESGMERLISSKKAGGGLPPKRMLNPVGLIYTDEDKCEEDDAGRFKYFDPNIKPGFNFDYLLSNNYICHFLVVRTDLAQQLLLRSAYDGAQDFDFTLRVCAELMKESPAKERTLKALVQEVDEGLYGFKMHEGSVVHVPKVLYHWRSHVSSTAANPASKKYAYDAGRRAVQNFLDAKNVKARVTDLPHVGFYRVNYMPDAIHARTDVGAVGGRLVDENGTVTGGAMREDGTVIYAGLPKGYSGGILHRAVLQQDVDAVDVRNMVVKMEFEKRLNELTLMNEEELMKLWSESEGTGAVTHSSGEERVTAPVPLTHSADILRSLILCREIRDAGYRILYDPQM